MALLRRTVPSVNGETTCTIKVRVPPAAGAKLPKDQVTTPPASVPPSLAEMKTVLDGSVSTMVDPGAVSVVLVLLYVSV